LQELSKGNIANQRLPGLLQDRSWIEQSWRRCLSHGFNPEKRVDFDIIPKEALTRTEEANHNLLRAAKPVLKRLSSAIASTRYFAILTDEKGVVIDTDGAIDYSDARATAITRIGVNLSEYSIGTSAISAALHEHQTVWLHRGEHFFIDTSVYSCAGTPLFSPLGMCLGMLDLTGIDTQERPELIHLVEHSAKSIENALVHALPYTLMIRVNWPGMGLGSPADGLLALDRDGRVLGFNQTAKKILSMQSNINDHEHAKDIFAMPFERLFDAARAGRPCFDVPLWSGLCVDTEPLYQHQEVQQHKATQDPVSRLAIVEHLQLKDITTNLMKQAVRDSKGNVAVAARKLGISRATLYRKLAPESHKVKLRDPL
jgi:transcriptional regulator of acetoin/glycerol metabolism